MSPEERWGLWFLPKDGETHIMEYEMTTRGILEEMGSLGGCLPAESPKKEN